MAKRQTPNIEVFLRQQASLRAARFATVNRISRLITGSLSLDQTLQTTVEAIHEHLHYAVVGVLLIDPEDPTTLVLRARSHVDGPSVIGFYRQPMQEGIIGAAVRTRQHILVGDVRSDTRYRTPQGARKVRAEVVVPIMVGDRLLGVLRVESEQAIVEDDASGLQIIADQLGVAIDNAELFARTQHALEETQLLYETCRRMSTAMDVDDVIAAYLEQVAMGGRYVCTVILYEFDETGARRYVTLRGRWTPQDGLTHPNERLPHTRDAFDPLLDAGESVTIADFRVDPRVSPELRRLQSRNQRPAWAMIPLIARGHRIGLVILSYTAVHQWCEADLQPYQATAALLAAALESRRQHLLLSERGHQLAVLEERLRLAWELHDSVTQLIFSMTLIAQSIAPAWQRNPSEGEHRVQRLLALSQSALSDMRALLAELRPDEGLAGAFAAEDMLPGVGRVPVDGLAAAIRRHTAEVAREGLAIDVDVQGDERQALDQEEVLYRIAQAGAVGYMLKDVLKTELLRTIRAAAQRQLTPHREAQHQLMQQVATPTTRPLFDDLTPRERDVLCLLVQGQSNKEIAGALGVSEGTVKGHVSAILSKLGVLDRTQAALYAVKHGFAEDG
jgi:GAF domain-containing protein/DNA-binding CsgD family transcriptional regulator